MTTTIILVPVGLCLFYTLWSLFALTKNYLAARKMGFPIVVSPVGVMNPVWAIFGRQLWPMIAKLPGGGWTRYNYRGWNFMDKYKIHKELGDFIVHVTPREIEMYVADAAAANRILLKSKEFIHPLEMMQMTGLFGDNIATADGKDWSRQRKITSQPFSERNSDIVWSESMRQVVQMAEYWDAQGVAGVTTVSQDTMTLGLHVLTCAGLGISYEFKTALEKAEDGYTMNYRDCLDNLLSNIMFLAFFPKALYEWSAKSLSFLPKSVQDYATAVQQFRRYTAEMVQAERERISCGKGPESNLLSIMVQKTDEARKEASDPSAKKSGVDTGLKDTEIYGNLFIFNLAGHETTAHTFGYTIYLLAACPELQEWAREEIDYVYSKYPNVKTPPYGECFPQLKRCLALMLETLRIYSPLLQIPKITPNYPIQVDLDGRMITIPPNTDIKPNVVALQTDPAVWGEKSLNWDPTRWITTSFGSATTTTTKATSTTPKLSTITDEASIFASETISSFQKGSYIPWSDGPRACPGKKFSQVEIVAAISGLLREFKVEVVPREGESLESAKKRVLEVTDHSNTNFTLQMLEPETVRIRVVRRV